MDKSWEEIFIKYNIRNHNFDEKPFYIKAEKIKEATKHFKKTNEKEVRILCYQITREKRPKIFKDNGLFILPVKNGDMLL